MATSLNETKSASEIADETRDLGRDATQAARGYAAEAAELGRDAARSIRPSVDDALATGREAADTVRGVAGDAKAIAGDTLNLGRAYARNATQAASRVIDDARTRIQQQSDDCVKFVRTEPMKATLYAVIAGAVTAMLLGAALRSGRRGRSQD
jgi:GAF domain-containing protein